MSTAMPANSRARLPTKLRRFSSDDAEEGGRRSGYYEGEESPPAPETTQRRGSAGNSPATSPASGGPAKSPSSVSPDSPSMSPAGRRTATAKLNFTGMAVLPRAKVSFDDLDRAQIDAPGSDSQPPARQQRRARKKVARKRSQSTMRAESISQTIVTSRPRYSGAQKLFLGAKKYSLHRILLEPQYILGSR
jgi:hypothetical protein